MSRPEAQALGGYYKTPSHLTPFIGALVQVVGENYQTPCLVDPCAGTGEALLDLAVSMFGQKQLSRHSPYRLYAVELEKERATACKRTLSAHDSTVLRGDAMCVDWGPSTADFLYLNPPYDPDKSFGRLEHRFLTRFTSLLTPGNGILFFVVPHKSLEASAEYLATRYTGMRCYRFPDEDFQAFQQVVLVGQRRDYPARFVSAADTAEINAWANHPHDLPVLGSERGVIVFNRGRSTSHIARWKLEEIALEGIYEQVRPFMYGKTDDLKLVHGLGIDTDLTDFMGATFPVVLPPRPVHVAIALASGLMNGERITPDDPQSGLPDLMVKGTFRKEYKTVEEKRNKDGGITSVVQVQQPELQVSALDMTTWTYFDLKAGVEPNDYRTSAQDMNVADLLKRYGKSLVRLMTRQCPPLHNPNDPSQDVTLPPMGKTPYVAQKATIVGSLKQLFTDQFPFAGENSFVLGEVGTGKTIISQAIAESLSRRNFTAIEAQMRQQGITGGRAVPVNKVLVMCPPHLVQNWKEEIASVLPAAAVLGLERLTDIDNAAAFAPEDKDGPGAGLTFLLMSREMAKLGHSWKSGVGKHRTCPGCGHKIAATDTQIVGNRMRCQHSAIVAQDDLGKMAIEMANLLAVYPGAYEHIEKFLTPNHHRLARLITHRNRAVPVENLYDYERQSWLDKACPATKKLENTPLGKMIFPLGDMTLDACKAENWGEAKRLSGLMIDLFMTIEHPERETLMAFYGTAIYRAACIGKYIDQYTDARNVRDNGQMLFLLMRPHLADMRDLMLQALRSTETTAIGRWSNFDSALNRLRRQCDGEAVGVVDSFGEVTSHDGEIRYRRSYNEKHVSIASSDALIRAFRSLLDMGSLEHGKPCGTPLFTAVPEPRRFPLADYICQRHPDLFDMLILDEAHEYNTDGSAQERAAHKLSALGKPIFALTGTSNNGYSSSLFANMWAFSRRFRREFGREDVAQFVTRYGYRKVRVDADGKSFVPKDYGSMSDRRDTGVSLTMRKIGEAPGILPLFVLKHMLPVSVIIHKEDMDHDLPPMVELPEPIEIDRGLLVEHDAMREKLVTAIMTDMRQGRAEAGKLWGQMAQLPSYLDRPHSDTGNVGEPGDRRYEIRYPESVGAALVAAATPFPSDYLTPKEEWLLEKVHAELDENRPVLLFVVNTRSGLGERLRRLLSAQSITTVYLDATKVSAGKRQEWITNQVIKKKRQVLIVNPEAVETGLNNLVYFPTAIWYQNPNCSPITYSQANGRLHRPGQLSDEVRIYFPYYAGTTQELQLKLLGHKVAAVRQADGLDISSALVAAGASGGGDVLQTMSVGRALYEMLVSRTDLSGANHFATIRRSSSNGQASRPQLVKPEIQPVVYQEKPTQMRLLESRSFYAATD